MLCQLRYFIFLLYRLLQRDVLPAHPSFEKSNAKNDWTPHTRASRPF